MKLPFTKKSDAPGQSAAPKKKRGSANVPESALARPRRQGNHWANEWDQPQAPPGSPGICGYLNGVKGHESKHPDRFVYVRPDGQPDDTRQVNPDEPLRPSTRPVPRGFFGP